LEERLVEKRAEYLAERTLMEESVRGPNFDQGLVDELNKKRGMPTVPTRRKTVVVDEMAWLKETSDWDALVQLAAPFQLHTARGELTVDHYFDISIRHDSHGYATRRIVGSILSGIGVRDAIIDMKKELGFGSSVYSDLKKEEVPIVPVKQAQSQHHTCGRHGNQLVAARNTVTGESALRCPVVGCETVLVKRRRGTVAA
jgi:hypothetical protein